MPDTAGAVPTDRHVADAADTREPAEADYVSSMAEVEQLLEDVDRALARLESGAYWTCTVCARPIGESRLSATPVTQVCEEHAS